MAVKPDKCESQTGPELLKIWCSDYKLDFDADTVTLPRGNVANLADVSALIYLLHMRGERELLGKVLSLGKSRYISIYNTIGKEHPTFLEAKKAAAEEMEDELINTLCAGGEYNS